MEKLFSFSALMLVFADSVKAQNKKNAFHHLTLKKKFYFCNLKPETQITNL